MRPKGRRVKLRPMRLGRLKKKRHALNGRRKRQQRRHNAPRRRPLVPPSRTKLNAKQKNGWPRPKLRKTYVPRVNVKLQLKLTEILRTNRIAKQRHSARLRRLQLQRNSRLNLMPTDSNARSANGNGRSVRLPAMLKKRPARPKHRLALRICPNVSERLRTRQKCIIDKHWSQNVKPWLPRFRTRKMMWSCSKNAGAPKRATVLETSVAKCWPSTTERVRPRTVTSKSAIGW